MSADDSTDWLVTAAPYVHKFEDNLRCPICRELLVRAPSITECGHTFCGECIMRHLNTSSNCPVCRANIQRGKIRPNKAIGDLADLWQSGTRQGLLDLASKPVVNGTSDITTKPDQAGVVNDSDEESSSKPTPVSAPLREPEPGPVPEIPEGYAQCPICGKVLPILEIQTTHIAQCLKESSEPKPEPSVESIRPHPKRQKKAVFGQEFPENRLVVPHFHSMSDTKLKAKMKDLGLPVKGSRQRIIARYMEWLTIWNASVDDKHPKTVTALRKQLAEWDKAQDSIGDATPSLKSLDAHAWSQKNNDSFADLISQARHNMKKTSVDDKK